LNVRSRNFPKTARSCGFTLIEILVVMVVLGLLLGATVLVVRPSDREMLRLDAERLAQLIGIAAEEADTSGKPLRWVASATGYGFRRMRADGVWTDIRDDDLLRARNFLAGTTISALRTEAGLPAGTLYLDFLPGGVRPIFAIEMTRNEERVAVMSSPIGDIFTTTHGGAADGVPRPQ